MKTTASLPNVPSRLTLRRLLLAGGALASLLYAGTDVIAAISYPEYHSFNARAVSEPMARGAPTEGLVDPLFLIYLVLMLGFGVGVWMSGREKRLRIMSLWPVEPAKAGTSKPSGHATPLALPTH